MYRSMDLLDWITLITCYSSPYNDLHMLLNPVQGVLISWGQNFKVKDFMFLVWEFGNINLMMILFVEVYIVTKRMSSITINISWLCALNGWPVCLLDKVMCSDPYMCVASWGACIMHGITSQAPGAGDNMLSDRMLMGGVLGITLKMATSRIGIWYISVIKWHGLPAKRLQFSMHLSNGDATVLN